jgi:hypothetical protein
MEKDLAGLPELQLGSRRQRHRRRDPNHLPLFSVSNVIVLQVATQPPVTWDASTSEPLRPT